MKREGDPQDWRLVVLLARGLKGWTYQQDMAQACRIDVGSISDYEKGLKVPSPATRKKMAAGMGVEASFLEQLVPLCRGIRLSFEKALRSGSTADDVDQQQVEDKIAGTAQEAMAPFLLELAQLAEPRPHADDLAWAEDVRISLAPLSPEDQRMIATTLQSERNWALAFQFCEASEKSESPDEALSLAHLAVDLTRELDPSPWQLRLLGWCEVFVGAALRAQGDLEEAQETFDGADEYWTQGAAGDPAGLLDEQRRATVKAGA